jgi:glycopeptide antibiotics resistance protein
MINIRRWNRKIIIIIFILYSMLILWEMFLGPYRTKTTEMGYNLFPLKSIFYFFENYSKESLETFLINITGNIAFFIPFGFFLPLIFKGMNGLLKISLLTIGIIFFLEIMQMVLKVGYFDIDDILLNWIGIIIGYFICKMSRKIFFTASQTSDKFK